MEQSSTPTNASVVPRRLNAGAVAFALIPLLLLGGLLALLVITGAGLGTRTAPPIEELHVDRISLPTRDQMVVEVTNGGADSVTVAQVLEKIMRLMSARFISSRRDKEPRTLF